MLNLMFFIVSLFISDVKRIYESETIFVPLGPEFELYGTVGFMNLIVVPFMHVYEEAQFDPQLITCCRPFAVPI